MLLLLLSLLHLVAVEEKKKGRVFSNFQIAVGAETVKNEPPAAASALRTETVADIFTVLIKQICCSTVNQGIKTLYLQFCDQITIQKHMRKQGHLRTPLVRERSCCAAATCYQEPEYE